MNSADALASYRIPAPEGQFLLPAVSMRCYWALPAYPPPLSFSSCMASAMVVTYLQDVPLALLLILGLDQTESMDWKVSAATTHPISCGACCPALSGRYTGPCMSRWSASPPSGVNALLLGIACSSTASLHIILHGRSDGRHASAGKSQEALIAFDETLGLDRQRGSSGWTCRHVMRKGTPLVIELRCTLSSIDWLIISCGSQPLRHMLFRLISQLLLPRICCFYLLPVCFLCPRVLIPGWLRAMQRHVMCDGKRAPAKKPEAAAGAQGQSMPLKNTRCGLIM